MEIKYTKVMEIYCHQLNLQNIIRIIIKFNVLGKI